jgi:hypothetical protein
VTRWALLLLVACRPHKATPSPAPSASPTPSASATPIADCPGSCAAGVCSDCPIKLLNLSPTPHEQPHKLAFAGDWLAWDWDGNHISARDVCRGTALDVDWGKEGTPHWSQTARGFAYMRGNAMFEVENGKERKLAKPFQAGSFRLAADGTVFTADVWIDDLSMPHKSGWSIERGNETVAGNSLPELVVDGNDAYFVDGPSIMHATTTSKPTVVHTTTDALAPAPVAKFGATLYAVRGWARQIHPLPGTAFELVAIEAGKARSVYSGTDASCFAINSRTALACVGDELVAISLAGGGSRVLLHVDREDRNSGTRTTVALAEDGAFARSVPSKPGILQLQRQPCP